MTPLQTGRIHLLNYFVLTSKDPPSINTIILQEQSGHKRNHANRISDYQYIISLQTESNTETQRNQHKTTE